MKREAERLAEILSALEASDEGGSTPAVDRAIEPELAGLVEAADWLRPLRQVPPAPGGLHAAREAFIDAGAASGGGAEPTRAPSSEALLRGGGSLLLLLGLGLMSLLLWTSRQDGSRPGRSELPAEAGIEAEGPVGESGSVTDTDRDPSADSADSAEPAGVSGEGAGEILPASGLRAQADPLAGAPIERQRPPALRNPPPSAAPIEDRAATPALASPTVAGAPARVPPPVEPPPTTSVPPATPTSAPPQRSAEAPKERDRQRLKWEGVLEAVGPERWRVGGVSFLVAGGEINEDRGLAKPGAQVRVEVERVGETLRLLRLTVLAGIAEPEIVALRGRIEAIEPAHWVLDGRILHLTAETRIEGEPALGRMANVEADYYPAGARDPGERYEARIIRVETAEVLIVEFEGRLDALEAAAWIVDGLRIEIGPETRIEGRARVGDRVQVRAAQLPEGRLLGILLRGPASDSGPDPTPTLPPASPRPTESSVPGDPSRPPEAPGPLPTEPAERR